MAVAVKGAVEEEAVEEGLAVADSAQEEGSVAMDSAAKVSVVVDLMVADSAAATELSDSAVVAMEADSAAVGSVEAGLEMGLEVDSESKPIRRRGRFQSHRESVL